jgi:PKD repeat protein
MRERHLLYIVFALVIVGLIGIPPVAATGEERIAFSANPRVDDPDSIPGYYYPGNRIHMMAPDGSGLIWFGGYPADREPIHPSWSPDCSKIVATRMDWGTDTAQIIVMDADATEWPWPYSMLTWGPDFDAWLDGPILGQVDPAWSPLGSLIAYASDDWRDPLHTGNPPGLDIYVMKPDGSDQTRLTAFPGSHEDPAWSPDGSKIAFASNRDGNYEIYIMDADGSNPVRVTDNPATDRKPAWSFQGQIAFVSDRDGNKEVYVIDPDGTGETRLTDDPDNDSDPAWSPDGSQIVFVRGGGDPTQPYDTELYIMDKYGGQQTSVLPGSDMMNIRDPTWGPYTVPNKDPVGSFSADPDQGLAPLTVAFDASGTSDPDGTIVSYAWSFGDGTTGSGVTVSHTYATPGAYSAILTVTDDDGSTACATRSIVVKTPAEGIADLATRVESYGIRADIETGLTDKLDAAIEALNRGNDKAAINTLNAFINLVKAQRGKTLTPERADSLTAAAQELIANLRL